MRRAQKLISQGLEAVALNDYTSALAKFRKSAETFATADALVYWGWMEFRLGDIDTALELCHKALDLDPDFGRGQSAYNDCLGDPGHKPNASLGPLDRAPYYATEIYPGDVGTCGGLITNEHAQVLDETDAPIPGLYATGNVTATVMGRTYPGAGASIANTMVFGYVAAHHAAGHDAEVR